MGSRVLAAGVLGDDRRGEGCQERGLAALTGFGDEGEGAGGEQDPGAALVVRQPVEPDASPQEEGAAFLGQGQVQAGRPGVEALVGCLGGGVRLPVQRRFLAWRS